MNRRRSRPESARGLVAQACRYALVSLVPVVLLGVALSVSYRHEAERRGLAEGRSEARMIAQTGVEPLLDGKPIGTSLSTGENQDLTRLVRRAVWSHDILRLRLRNLAGQVVFSDDGSGFSDRPEDEALRAAGGDVIALLTRLNSDRNDNGAVGPAAVEIYLPVVAGQPAARVGVLELYLPYAPIRQDVAAGMGMLYRNLAVGLGLLWFVLLGIAWSLSRGLRRQVRVNAYQAEHDALTDLPNRVLFLRRAAAAVHRARADRKVCLAIVDLDRFKEVNDTLGHHNGDALLTQLASRLRQCVGDADTVARLGGDEFGIVLVDEADPAAALSAIRDVIVDELEVCGLPLAVEASVGLALAPDHGDDVDTLLQRADVAMYVAKAQHLAVVAYDPAFDHYDALNLTLVANLRHAIDADELVLHYQPKVGVVDGRVEAVEALVRWQHPSLGLLGPDRFLPLAEQTELIDKLTCWVLRRAVSDLATLPEPQPAAVAVNISARNLTRWDFADTVMELLAEAGVPAERLILEITETALLQDPKRAAHVLTELAERGVRISLDDFGAGQTSLGYLSALPVNELKIDKSFVLDMLGNAAHHAIVRSIVELGHNLRMKVVAEGVENREVLLALGAVGCDVAQGYYFARPMTAGALGRWLDQGDRAASDGAPALVAHADEAAAFN